KDGAFAGRWPLVRPHNDKDDAEPGMGDGHRRDDRVGSPSTGRLYGDKGFPPSLRSLCGEAQAGLRGGLRWMVPPSLPAPPAIISTGHSSMGATGHSP